MACLGRLALAGGLLALCNAAFLRIPANVSAAEPEHQLMQTEDFTEMDRVAENAAEAIVAGDDKDDKSWSGCRPTKGKIGSPESVKWAPKRRLNFVHIPRDAGTTVESCSRYFPASLAKWGTMNPAIQGGKKIPGRKEKCYGQHVPPAMFPGVNPYKLGAAPSEDNFCVVRHPYERLISQFGFVNIFSRKGKYSCTKDSMNAYLLQELKKVDQGAIFLADCHFTPETLFVFGYDKKTWKYDRSQRWCKHVLRFENFSADFNKLMAEFDYAVQIGDAHKKDGRHMGSKPSCRDLKPSDFSPEVRALADKIYKDDFEEFGYSKTV